MGTVGSVDSLHARTNSKENDKIAAHSQLLIEFPAKSKIKDSYTTARNVGAHAVVEHAHDAKTKNSGNDFWTPTHQGDVTTVAGLVARIVIAAELAVALSPSIGCCWKEARRRDRRPPRQQRR